jgi:hypothetical protein
MFILITLVLTFCNRANQSEDKAAHRQVLHRLWPRSAVQTAREVTRVA